MQIGVSDVYFSTRYFRRVSPFVELISAKGLFKLPWDMGVRAHTDVSKELASSLGLMRYERRCKMKKIAAKLINVQ